MRHGGRPTLDRTEEELFRQYAAGRLAALRRTAFLICGDWHAAEDAVSVVMTKLYVSWTAVRRGDNVDAWVRRALVKAVTASRRPAARYPLTNSGAGDERVVLRAALAQMPTRRRAVLVLRYFESLTVDETAAAVGCSAGAVQDETARALETLRAVLPADYLLQEGASW